MTSLTKIVPWFRRVNFEGLYLEFETKIKTPSLSLPFRSPFTFEEICRFWLKWEVSQLLMTHRWRDTTFFLNYWNFSQFRAKIDISDGKNGVGAVREFKLRWDVHQGMAATYHYCNGGGKVYDHPAGSAGANINININIFRKFNFRSDYVFDMKLGWDSGIKARKSPYL